MMVFDTLFGMDSAYQMQPQMLEGFSVEDGGKRWKLVLRDGLCGTMASAFWRATASPRSAAGRCATASAAC